MLGGLSWWKLVKIHLCPLHWTNRRIITSKRYPDSFGMGGVGVWGMQGLFVIGDTIS